jgi:hypothetical protein
MGTPLAALSLSLAVDVYVLDRLRSNSFALGGLTAGCRGFLSCFVPMGRALLRVAKEAAPDGLFYNLLAHIRRRIPELIAKYSTVSSVI